MRDLRGTYVHKGDAQRRRDRVRKSVLAVGFVGAVMAAWSGRAPEEASAEPSFFSRADEIRRVQSELDATRGELDLANAQLERWNKVYDFSSKYGIGADLATMIYDVSLAEGIAPEVGFQLVRIESEFNPRATSPVGAVGLTQLMPATAKFFEPGITREKLYDRHTNLRIGFRYLRTLIKEYKGDVNLALLVYNRGPVAVKKAQSNGINPSNGYERLVMRNFKGKATID
jgi:hypothetical protein